MDDKNTAEMGDIISATEESEENWEPVEETEPSSSKKIRLA